MCGPGVTVSFTRAINLAHVIRIRRERGTDGAGNPAAGERFVSVSSEGECDVDPARVSNPVYQELVKHELPRGQGPGLCVLLTGSSFQHHFSAVFGLYCDRAMPSAVVLEVNLADRCRMPIKTLAATYSVDHVDGEPGRFDARAHAVIWRGGPLGDGTLELLAEPPASVSARQMGDASTVLRVEGWIDPKTFTQRLNYRWRWTSCADLTR
jgi:hypothetical protein